MSPAHSIAIRARMTELCALPAVLIQILGLWTCKQAGAILCQVIVRTVFPRLRGDARTVHACLAFIFIRSVLAAELIQLCSTTLA
jgi:hypothetical protein